MNHYHYAPALRPPVYRHPIRIGTVATICRVCRRTVLNWIRQGALRSFTTQGGHHRIWPADLHYFLTQAGIDVDFRFVDDRQTAVLVVSPPSRLSMKIKGSLLSAFPAIPVVQTDDPFEALMLIGQHKPELIVWDSAVNEYGGKNILQFLIECKKAHPMYLFVFPSLHSSFTQQPVKYFLGPAHSSMGQRVDALLHHVSALA